MADQNKSYREETELIGKDAAAIERIMQARLDDAIAAKQQQLAMLQNADASQGEIGALEDQINLLQQRKGLLTQRGVAEQLAADAEEAKRINDVFVDSFTEGVTSIVTGAKSVKAAFHDMEKSIVDSLTRMAAKRAGKLLFGGSGSSGPGLLGDLGSWFQKLLGGALGGGGGGAEEVFQFGRAVGGPVAANHPYIVGEKGQELFVPRQAGNIIPNDVLTSMRAQRQVVNNISVNVLPGASRETGRQAAMEMARQLNQAAARNG
jgi:hypothetical protein